MIKDAIIRIVALVVVLACVFMLNTVLTEDIASADGIKISLERGGWSGNMDRFLGHTNWMRLLQYRAKVSSKKPDPAVVTALYNRYDTLTDQNPFMVIAYEHGGIELATMGNSQLALKLLEKGMETTGDSNWKLPFYAAHIAHRYIKDDGLAEKYLQKTRKISGHPTHVESQLVRIIASKTDNDPLTKAKLWQNITKNDATSVGGGIGPDGQKRALEISGFPTGDSKINAKARQEVIKLLREVRSQASKATGKEKQDMEAKAGEIEIIVTSLSPSAHVCKYCFAGYQAGDKFCPHCGKDVKVFGVCRTCKTVLESGKKFCTQCGTSVSKPKPAPAAKKTKKK